MTRFDERKVRRLFADHGLIIHKLRRGRHWCVQASRDGGPIRSVTITPASGCWYALRKIEADLRRVRRAA